MLRNISGLFSRSGPLLERSFEGKRRMLRNIAFWIPVGPIQDKKKFPVTSTKITYAMSL
jgi:hypothetical protein